MCQSTVHLSSRDLLVGPVLPYSVLRDQCTPPLEDFPYMLKSVSTKCVETGCLYRGLEACGHERYKQRGELDHLFSTCGPGPTGVT